MCPLRDRFVPSTVGIATQTGNSDQIVIYAHSVRTTIYDITRKTLLARGEQQRCSPRTGHYSDQRLESAVGSLIVTETRCMAGDSAIEVDHLYASSQN
jgi:hypothetical protein